MALRVWKNVVIFIKREALALLPSSFFLLPSSFFLLPSSFFLLPSSFFLLPSSFFPPFHLSKIHNVVAP